MLYYNTIKPLDVANGKGISCSIFFQGCSHHCKNCFNQETWSFKGGKEFNEKEQEEFIKNANKSVVSSISILGGDPLQQDSEDLYNFLKRLKEEVNKPIFLWTGYIYEEIPKQYLPSVYDFVDVLIDGRFEEDKKNLMLRYRGSSNQRVIDIKETLKEGRVVLYE